MDTKSLSSSSADSLIDNSQTRLKQLSPVHTQTPDLTDGKNSDENLSLSSDNRKPSPSSSSSDSLSTPIKALSPGSNQNPPDDGWEALWDNTSQQYYFYNRFTNETTWVNPRVPPQTLAERLAKDPEFQCLSKRDKIKRYEYEQQLEQQLEQNQHFQQQHLQQPQHQQMPYYNNQDSIVNSQQPHYHHFFHLGHHNRPEINENEHIQMLASAFGTNNDDSTRNKGLRVTKKEFKKFKKKKQQKKEKKQREWLLND